MAHEQTRTPYITDHTAFEAGGASASPAWMKRLRSAGIASFREQGFPGQDREDWRFTNIAPLTKQAFSVSPKRDYSAVTRESLEAHVIQQDEHRFVFVNGHFSASLSAVNFSANVEVFNLASSEARENADAQRHCARHAEVRTNPFAALNTAFLLDGLFVQIPEGITIDAPIHVLNVSVQADDEPARASYPRLIIAAARHSAATVVESFIAMSERASFTDAVTEIVLEAHSSLDYIKLQHEHAGAFHMHTITGEQHAESRLNIFSLAMGGAISRSEISVALEGEKADVNVNGLYMADGTQLTDHHTFIRHKVPECTSHELFKGILDGSARAVYTGKVYVDAIAQKTDSKQTNRNLMLSDAASVDTQPQLEIFADDVKCTHGATVGGMNESLVFYLKSRGIGGSTARGIVTIGFAAEVTEKIDHAASRSMVDALVVSQLRKKLGNEIPEIVHSGKHDEKE